MAYINVAEWLSDQVIDWLKGLDNCLYRYINSFTNNAVGGLQLLNVRPFDLEQKFGIRSIGHQEIILEAVEHLKNFHYNLDKENLQFLALHVATSANSLKKQLEYNTEKNKLETMILKDITRTISLMKNLVAWLDKPPFYGEYRYQEIRTTMLQLGLEMAASAQRDRFVENPVEHICNTAKKIAKLAEIIIQDLSDPMLLQTATLDLVKLKKRESDLGFSIIPSFHGIHRITDIKYNSPAHNSGKIEEGDEIVQINYQTVVGWQYKKVLMQLEESPPDVILTLKKRPKHTKMYGQIYIKPYRLPSKKRSLQNRWGENLPSPRPELMLQNFVIPLPRVPEKHVSSDSDSGSSEILTPTDPKQSDKDLRLYLPKPRAVIQRRHTFSNFKDLRTISLWSERKNILYNQDSPSLRDKSASFGFGLEMAIQRPTTCLGISTTDSKFNDFTAMKGSLQEIPENYFTTMSEYGDSSKPGVSKVVRFDSNMQLEEYPVDHKFTCNIDNTLLETFEPIPYVDEEEINNEPEVSTNENKKAEPIPQITNIPRKPSKPDVIQAINSVLVNRDTVKRGRLDKSYSTPAYDDTDDELETPPAIEPRREHLLKLPPPRPIKSFDTTAKSTVLNTLIPTNPQSSTSAMFVKPFIKNNVNNLNDENNKSKIANVIDLKNKEVCQNIVEAVNQNNQRNIGKVIQIKPVPKPPLEVTETVETIPVTKDFLAEPFESLELLTPNRTKSLTLKKKNNILAKRRKITLQSLGTSDIQGHLFRRAKYKETGKYWAKNYFVLIDTALYGFKSKESLKANCMIFLSGFTVSKATEVHSKSFAFKVYHTSKTFYFAAETEKAQSQWIEYIKQATLKGGQLLNTNAVMKEINVKELYSETDSSDDEYDIYSQNKELCTPSPLQNVNSRTDTELALPSATKLDFGFHLGFGSLKKFAKSNVQSSESNGNGNSEGGFLSLFSTSKYSERKLLEKKSSPNDIPVPTAQFRSYRKVHGQSGIQVGTNAITSNANHEFHHTPMTPLSPSSPPTPTMIPPTVEVVPSTPKHMYSVANFLENLPPPPPITNDVTEIFITPPAPSSEIKVKSKKPRTSPNFANFIHASNPNLVEFDFQTSKAIGFTSPKINSGNTWDNPNTFQNCVTLKDLMLQKQEEEAKDMYNKRVCLGIENTEDRSLRRTIISDVDSGVSSLHISNGPTNSNRSNNNENIEDPKIHKIQKRSLPITPDYAQSFKPDDQNILYTRSKEGQKLRDFGYELISGDDNSNASKNATQITESGASAKRNDKISASGSIKKKPLTWIIPEKRYDEERQQRQGSIKKTKNKLDNLKASSEKLFQFKYSNNNDKESLKSKQTDKSTTLKPVQTYTPMTLPLNRKSSQIYNTNMEGQTNGNSSHQQLTFQNSIRKSNTCNTPDFNKDNIAKFQNVRKNSAPERSTSSYFNKLPFTSNKTSKEKKLLGSPRLHRALFGRNLGQNDQNTHPHTMDHESFSPITYIKAPPAPLAPLTTSLSSPPGTSFSQQQAHHSNYAHHSQHGASTSTLNSKIESPDYPNMEYPPVFEPEIYSLSDPNATLLKRRNNQSK